MMATYSCPKCTGTLESDHGCWTCCDCGYAPPHGAD
jgi:ribosomal protein L37AE/L43A